MKDSRNYIPALLSAILFVIGALLLLGIGVFMGLAAIVSLASGKGIKAEETIFFVAFSFEGLVLLAAAFFAFQKFLRNPSVDRSVTASLPNWLIAVLAIVAGVSILIGYQIDGLETINWLVLPVLTLPVVVLPVGILLALGIRNLPFGTRWQTWNTLGLGMTLTPLVLFMLEILAGLVVLVAIIAYVMTQPGLASELQRLSRQITLAGPQSESALALLSPFLTSPGVIATVLLYMSLLVPAIEELFKPLGVWVLAGKLESPAQGFTLGALSGAGYALIETIGVSGQSAGWASLLFSRVGTDLLHVTTSALMGAAIVLAVRERRYARLAGTYALTILLHGLWNSTAILFTFSGFAESSDPGSRLAVIQPVLSVAMLVLAVGLFAILMLSNRRLRKTIPPPPTQAVAPGENADTGETV